MHDCDREPFAVKAAAHVFVLSLSVVTAVGLTICPQYVGPTSLDYCRGKFNGPTGPGGR
jgi:hypothetical protein